ncbi:Na(+)/H(+) antiporter NhaA [Nocardioides psychrotolerans]|uniref:Na(+)/H(+) antiporter NhaA n=1 Tax=Nocardioides psychrotolerans TaxID=1005945 RepID=A0A1I3DVI8_9ACTN|nr:Na+/H+ antiporter NhaA [Nocardioides psychrotolerans]GEP39255.1 Na(+)/H(+) antiporter NhaA [Nocardioides psychrotolerans]SFH90608.1 Na+:H+ antiporter, NhaA family [Nocardioides psychrotolerans]
MTTPPSPSGRTTSHRLFSRGTFLENSRVSEILRAETTGGLLLIIGATVAIVWANTPWADVYESIRDVRVGPESLHLDLSLGTWAADGLLAIFFFVAGLELKREFVAGDLRDPRRAAVPVAAAMGGMAAPALIFVLWNLGGDGGLRGWAIPTATDIAFAVAILAVISTHLPSGLRTFLLTLAVVDDLLAITIIAIFYTDELDLAFLALALVPIGLFGLLVQKRIHSGWLLVPLALVAWALVHESGVHATVAGVLLAFTVPVLRRDSDPDKPGLAEHLEHLVRPISAGFAVPVFAFFAAGVTVGGFSGLADSLRDPVALGIVCGLVVGKTVGIVGSTWLLATFTRADLDDELSWVDVTGMAMLAGIGFTVSLLIGELAFGQGSAREDHVKVGVLVGSLTAALLATIVLRARNRVYRRICELEERDEDSDGVPDVFQHDDSHPS